MSPYDLAAMVLDRVKKYGLDREEYGKKDGPCSLLGHAMVIICGDEIIDGEIDNRLASLVEKQWRQLLNDFSGVVMSGFSPGRLSVLYGYTELPAMRQLDMLEHAVDRKTVISALEKVCHD